MVIQQFYYCSVCPSCFFHLFSIHRFCRFSGSLLSTCCLQKIPGFFLCLYPHCSPCASMVILRFTFHICITISFFYAPPQLPSVSPSLHSKYQHTSFRSPAFLHSQPPTASLFCHQILCSVSSLASQVSNSPYSFPHQTFQSLLIQ